MTLVDLLRSLRTSEQPAAQRAMVAMDLLLSHDFSEADAWSCALAMLGELQFVRMAYPSHPHPVAHLARVVFVRKGKVWALSKCGAASDEIDELFVAPQESFKWGDEVPRRGSRVKRCKSCWRNAADETGGPIPKPWRPR